MRQSFQTLASTWTRQRSLVAVIRDRIGFDIGEELKPWLRTRLRPQQQESALSDIARPKPTWDTPARIDGLPATNWKTRQGVTLASTLADCIARWLDSPTTRAAGLHFGLGTAGRTLWRNVATGHGFLCSREWSAAQVGCEARWSASALTR
jgi:hypothetical protein